MLQSKFNLGLSVLFTLFFTGIINHLFAQVPNRVWGMSYGGLGEEYIAENFPQADGGYLVFGSTNSNNGSGDIQGSHGSADIWIIKTDSIGQIQWQKYIGGTGYERIHDAQKALDGGYIIVGETNSTDGDITVSNQGNYDVLVMKLDSLCNIQWQKSYGGSRLDSGKKIRLTTDGGYIIAATTKSNNGDIGANNTGNFYDYFDYWIVKIDAVGNLEWERAMGGYSNDVVFAVEQTDDGGYLIMGNSGSIDGDITDQPANSVYYNTLNIWLVKLASNGTTIWTKTLGGSGIDFAYCLIKTYDGNYIIGGTSDSDDGNISSGGNHGIFYDLWLLKIDGNANIIWDKSYGSLYNDKTFSLIETNDHGLLVIAFTAANQGNSGDVSSSPYIGNYWAIKLDEMGILQWDRIIGGSNFTNYYETKISTIRETPDHGYIMAVNSQNSIGTLNNHGSSDICLVRLGAFDVSWSFTSPNCYSGTDGTATVTPIGGLAPYTYTWSNGMSGDAQTGLAAGVYTVTIMDSNGGRTTITNSVTQPSSYSITPTVNNVSCYGGQNATINIAVSGATPPYTYEWNDGVTTPNRLGIPVGLTRLRLQMPMLVSEFTLELSLNHCL